ncbi:chorismate mutase [Candidatus Pacearchaeota archaeon]|nr:chorismate mutase [Candidatus Pacearchaeota archaeon]
MTELRREIDKTDAKILKLIEKRFEISKKIGEIKKENHIPVEDCERENEIINKEANNSRLSRKFISELFNLIFKESKEMQK